MKNVKLFFLKAFLIGQLSLKIKVKTVEVNGIVGEVKDRQAES